jgi:hypothetical protein
VVGVVAHFKALLPQDLTLVLEAVELVDKEQLLE